MTEEEKEEYEYLNHIINGDTHPDVQKLLIHL